MATLRERPPPPPPPARVLELELELRREPTYEGEQFVTDDMTDVTDTAAWNEALEEWLLLTRPPGSRSYVGRGDAHARFPDVWPDRVAADVARGRRDAALAAGRSLADAVTVMHDPAGACTCRRHAAGPSST